MNNFTKRRALIVSKAAGSAKVPTDIEYIASENEVWQVVSEHLAPMWDRLVIPQVLKAREKLALPVSRVPQLSEVTARLNQVSKFQFRSVGGLVKRDEFFDGLANGLFLSTQYLRHPSSPFYTDEPDIIHEVIGHGTLLVIPELAALHRQAGAALLRVQKESSRAFIANVWWFSGEFGVVLGDDGPKAFGAGILSSVGELENFTKNAEIRMLDISAMGQTEYRIDELQKILFAGYSLRHVVDVVGGFFETATDEMIDGMVAKDIIDA